MGKRGLVLPAQGEKLRIVGDIARVNDDPQVQKALRRLAGGLAPASVSQLVMWRLSGGLDWETIAQLSQKWANRSELTLAKDFVDQLSSLPEGESGRILFEITGTDPAGESRAAALTEAIKGKTILGLQAVIGVPVAAGSAFGGLPGAAQGQRGARPGVQQRRRSPELGPLRQVHAAGREGSRRSSTAPGLPMPWPRGSSTAWSGCS